MKLPQQQAQMLVATKVFPLTSFTLSACTIVAPEEAGLPPCKLPHQRTPAEQQARGLDGLDAPYKDSLRCSNLQVWLMKEKKS